MEQPTGEPSGSERVKELEGLEKNEVLQYEVDRRKLGEDFYFSLQGLTTEDTERVLFTIPATNMRCAVGGKLTTQKIDR